MIWTPTKDNPMQTVSVPLFSIRHGQAYGLASAVYNLVFGLSRCGVSVDLPYTQFDRLSPDFVDVATKDAALSFSQYRSIKGGMPTRFVEESLYALTKRTRGPVIFPNYFLPVAFPRASEGRFVIVHDCQHREFPNFFSEKKRKWLDFAFSRAFAVADKVFLISEFERKQIARFYGEAAAANCEVIYNSVDWGRYDGGEPSAKTQAIASEPYVLCVAHQYPHKQTLKIIEAALVLSRKSESVKFVFVGKISSEIEAFVQAADEAGLSKVVIAGMVSDADLGHLYRNARLFVSASSYEGFGLPAVEAMGLGVPTLVSSTTSLPEVTLGKAHYCDPEAPAEEWAARIEDILHQAYDPVGQAVLAEEVRRRYAPEVVANTVLRHIHS